MENASYGDIIFFALVAVYLAFKLTNTLGRKNEGDDNIGANPGSFSPESIQVQAPNVEEKKVETVKIDFRTEIEDFEFSSDEVKENVKDILEKDRTLSLSSFVEGAKGAFDMVLNAYSEGDKSTLKDMLSKDLYKEFTDQLAEFKKEKLAPTKSLVSITLDEISNASLTNNLANLTLKFTSEQINFVKNSKDEVVDGDASFIETVEDEWSFERNIRSSNPNWEITAI